MTALAVLRDRFPALGDLASLDEEMSGLTLEQADIRLYVPSQQASSVAGPLFRLDQAVRRATGVLDDRDFQNDGLPTVPPSVGGLVITGAVIGSVDLRAHLHGLSLEKFRHAPIVFALVTNLVCNVAND